MNELILKIKEFYKKHKLITFGVGFALLLVIPVLFPKSYIMGIIDRILLYALLAGGLNVINGYSSQFCIGYAAFFCIGAYTEAIMSLKLNFNFWILLPICGIFAATAGLLVCLPTLKLKGKYLSIVTLGFSEIVRLIALNWSDLTGGPMGLKGIEVPSFFGIRIKSSISYYYIFLGLVVIFLFVTGRVIKSRIGRAWMSIREDELAARSLGVETAKYKALNFMYGAFWAGVAGAAYAPYTRYIDSTFFTLDEGFNILSMVIIGGMGTLIGPVAGSIVVNLLTELLRPISEYRMVAYAILIIGMMWLRPQGLFGASNSILSGGKIKKREGKKRKKEVAA
ncbi:branched-chain amino acid ABC transporter permease [Anaerocolumna sp.]|uniref:branched-chain amino acid ABC transporter permease n=1 Tax=Anaerocolumna sp. TaxID=2041569 RepID=UPI0028AC1552|nr:branched-chain amino acid ABC transporter permease [Anaerocolumna sp.]